MKTIFHNNFLRNVATVASGVAGAQIITMLASPLITRIYSPETFGIMGIYMSIMAILIPISALSYPLAIILAKTDKEAKSLIYLSIGIAIITTLLSSIILAIAGNQLTKLFKIDSLNPYLLIIPISITIAALLQVAQQWLIRNEYYKLTAKASIYQALLNNGLKIGAGFLYPMPITLIAATIFSQIFQILFLNINEKNHTPKNNSRQKNLINNSPKKYDVLKSALKYSDFPLFRAPQITINALSQHLPIVMLGSFIGPSSAGLFILAKTVIVLPIGLIAKSFEDVFYPHISKKFHDGENIKKQLIRAIFYFGVLSFFPLLVIIITGPSLFEVVFGAEWRESGDYVRWLSIIIFFMFISKPCITAIPVLKEQSWFLLFEISSIFFNLTSILIGVYIYNDANLAIAFYTLSNSIAYIYLILRILKRSSEKSKVYCPQKGIL